MENIRSCSRSPITTADGSCQLDTSCWYKLIRFLEAITPAPFCSLSPQLIPLNLRGVILFNNLNAWFQPAAGIFLTLFPTNSLTLAGVILKPFHNLSANRYLLYPQNNSSPPSPERLTVTWRLAREETKNVGIWDASAKGSQ